MPEFLQDRVIERWIGDRLQKEEERLLDKELVVRDHGFAQSYQAFLLVDRPRAEDDSAPLRRLRQKMISMESAVIEKGLASVGLWGVLALIVFWLDRLTRGYMTGRLYTLGVLVGVAVPTVLLLS
jgi:hypothetical protein